MNNTVKRLFQAARDDDAYNEVTQALPICKLLKWYTMNSTFIMARCRIREKTLTKHFDSIRSFSDRYYPCLYNCNHEWCHLFNLFEKFRKNYHSQKLIREYQSMTGRYFGWCFLSPEELMNSAVDIDQFGPMLEAARMLPKLCGTKKIEHVHASPVGMGFCGQIL